MLASWHFFVEKDIRSTKVFCKLWIHFLTTCHIFILRMFCVFFSTPATSIYKFQYLRSAFNAYILIRRMTSMKVRSTFAVSSARISVWQCNLPDCPIQSLRLDYMECMPGRIEHSYFRRRQMRLLHQHYFLFDLDSRIILYEDSHASLFE